MSNPNLGDIAAGRTIRRYFNTVNPSTGAPITLAGTPAVSVYKDGGLVESAAGVTLTVDFDARTGMHVVAIDTSADGVFYAAGSEYHIVLTAGTVGGVSVVGRVIGHFTISNRTGLLKTSPAFRNVSAVTSPTFEDCLAAAFVECVDNWSVSGTTFLKRQPDNVSTFVTSTLDSATTPNSRTR